MRQLVYIASALLALGANARAQSAGPSRPIIKQRVSFKSGTLTLVGFLFKPAGTGPFPAMIWNHGSEKAPGATKEFDEIGAEFMPAGYVVFTPMRRGHGYSQGTYITDELTAIKQANGADAADLTLVHLMETEQLHDQLAGLDYVKSLPYVDTTRIVVAGCSYGGIQTLLAAEKGAGYKAAIAISPGALSWESNKFLQDRLLQAAQKIEIPVMLIQPAKDASLGPSKVLGPALQHLGPRYTGKVYPAKGPDAEQTHCFGGPAGTHVWAGDARAFLKAAGVTR